MSDQTYTVTFRITARDYIRYSVNLWPAERARSGWRPSKRATGTMRGPVAEQALQLLQELLEER